MSFDSTTLIWHLASAIGLVVTAIQLYQLFNFLTFHFWTSTDPLKHYRLKPSSSSKPYALITGSSGGIGYGFAQSLVKRGFGVILLSNDTKGLESAKQALKRIDPNAEVETVHMDATTATADDMKSAIIDKLILKKALQVTILINNVGGAPVAYPVFRSLADYTADETSAFVAMNAGFMTQLTRLMIPILSTAQRSLIVNMSSGGRSGLPWLSLYSASKAFNASISASLAREFKGDKLPIDCIAIVPGEVLSESNNLGIPKSSPTAERYGRMVLDRIDTAVKRGMLIMSPYWLHAVQIAAWDYLPESFLQGVLVDVMNEKKKAFARREEKGK